MKFNSLFVYLFLVFNLLCPSVAFAGFIRIDVNQEIVINEELRQVEVILTIINNGDEAAKSLSVDLPNLEKSFALKEIIAPNETISHKLEFSFEEIKLNSPGKYTFYYLVSYKDLNYYPFSSVRFFDINRLEAAPRAIFANIKSANPIAPVSLADSESVEIEIKNLSKESMTIQSLETAHPTEIVVSLDKDTVLPFSLEAGQNQVVGLDLTKAGALQGSNYAMGVIISGMKNEVHFSELLHFRTKIVATKASPRNIYQTFILGAAVLVIITWLLKMAMPSSRKD